jgi:hypothetical protein
MNSMDPQQFEDQLRRSASDLRYPPTPAIAAGVMRRSSTRAPRAWAWAAVAVFVVLAALMVVPPARAAILDFIQVGVVRIFRTQPAPAPVSTPASELPLTATPRSASATQPSTPAPASPLLRGLAGEMTLADAKSRAGFPILLPHYPPDLGQPDRVYLQDLGGSLVLLVWLQPDHPENVRMTLHEIAPGSWAVTKFNPQAIQEVTVNGQAGVWATGPYMLELRNHSYDERRLVQGNALIWTQDSITYRLESNLTLSEALKVAASLASLP